VNFDGTGTVAIRDSHNVSSITDNGGSITSINFTNNMSSENYTVAGSALLTDVSNNSQRMVSLKSDSSGAKALQVNKTVIVTDYNTAVNDCKFVTVTVFGG
jgi:hypothetical protein